MPPTALASPADALRRAIESATGRAPAPSPDFSPDGGVTVFGPAGRSARLQPLGSRTRVSLADGGGMTAEAEVDAAALIVGIGAGDCAYLAAATALGRVNGCGRGWEDSRPVGVPSSPFSRGVGGRSVGNRVHVRTVAGPSRHDIPLDERLDA